MKRIYLFSLTLTLPTLIIAHPFLKNDKNACNELQNSSVNKQIPPNSTQVIIVNAIEPLPKAVVTLCERVNSQWSPQFNPFYAMIGKNGIASKRKKKEGDLKTPAGAYPIGEAFGSVPLQLHLDFRFITPDDKFIDDVKHPQYNTWVYGTTTATRYERMLIDDYKMGAVINYNMNPIIPGDGSAIFMHIWKNSTTPTAGCVAMEATMLLSVLQWLDKRQHPYVYISLPRH